jgi:hypothetical protein
VIVPLSEGPSVGSFSASRQVIIAALDFLISVYRAVYAA